MLNMRGEGGLVIDGYLTFPESEEKNFIATLEATSYLTRDEVNYKVQRELLGWDATVLAIVTVTALFGLAHFRNWVSVPVDGGLWIWVGILTGATVLLHVVARFAIGWLRRYRYIYAIEQFKRYHADEQWIAIGEDVFPSSNDPYFRELRDQCIFNGFGLIIVEEDLQPKLHIAPSRVNLFADKRRIVEFFSMEELTRRLQGNPITGRWQQWLSWLPGVKQGERDRLLRFRQTYFHQMGICLLGLILLSTFLYREMQEKPVLYIAPEEYQAKMEQQKNAAPNSREPFGYLLDSALIPPFQTHYTPYPLFRDSFPPGHPGPVRIQPGLIIFSPGEGFFEYDCARLYDSGNPRFVIAVEIFNSERSLRLLIQRLREQGLEAMGVWLGCFSSSENDFVLFLGQLYSTREEAALDLPPLQDRLDRSGYSAKLEILPLQPNAPGAK